MTSEESVVEQQTEDPYADLKAEFTKQLADLRSEMESQVSELKTANDSLQKENSDLKRSLVRHTIVSPSSTEEVPLTPEQIYDQRVQDLSKSCVKYMQTL